MPFGLTNAPATFQALMDSVLKPLIGHCVIVYLDDILIFSATFENHEKHVLQVAQALADNQLVANPSKCSFFTQEIEYLGHIIIRGGIKMDPAKVESILDWTRPNSVHDVQVFMGLADYYRRFVKDFSRIASPLTALLRHKSKWQWAEEQEQAFTSLKNSFTTAPMLRTYDPILECRVATDASDKAIGGVLEQLFSDTGLWHPVAFESRKLIPAELNYPVHEKELLGIVHCLKTWRHCLEGQGHFKVFSDHLSLRYFHTQRDLSRRQARWAERLSSYDFEIIYKPGSQNHAPDALSRQPQLMNLVARFSLLPGTCNKFASEGASVLKGEDVKKVLRVIKLKPLAGQTSKEVLRVLNISVINNGLLELCCSQLSNDDWFNRVQLYLEDSTLPRPPSVRFQLRGLKLKHGLLFKDQQLFVPTDDLRTKIIRERHDASLKGHFSQNKGEELISRDYYWPQMSVHQRLRGLMQPMSTQQESTAQNLWPTQAFTYTVSPLRFYFARPLWSLYPRPRPALMLFS